MHPGEAAGAPTPPTILVFDSGLGGLTVLRAIQDRLPAACCRYALDDAAFPYGDWPREALVERVVGVLCRLLDERQPDACVIACNTASTLVLPHLRARYDLPFVGTVPAIKPAAERSTSGQISVLATPGTVQRDYTSALIRDFAAHCRVTLVGSAHLAPIAEAKLAGRPVDLDAIRHEIAPAFVDQDGVRTDTVVLACTHYPWLLDEMRAAAPWEVEWIDPAPAIARRVVQVLPREITAAPTDCGIVVTTTPQTARAVPADSSRPASTSETAGSNPPRVPWTILSRFGLTERRTLNLPVEIP
ncbi:MAG: glutamate racemase [Acidobacteriota bacterium]